MTAATAPAARVWRARLRRARRRHRTRSIGETLTNLYMLLWVTVAYGGALLSSVRADLHDRAGPPPVVAEHFWITIAGVLVGAGLVWQGLRALGPLLATPAEHTWGLSTPIDRRGWILPRFVGLLLAGAVTGAVTAVVAVALGLGGVMLGANLLAGGSLGIAGVAMGIAAQGAPTRRRWPRLVGATLLGTGAASATLLVVTHYLGGVPAAPRGSLSLAVAVVGLALAVVWVAEAFRTLPRLGAVALGTGADVAAAVMTAAIWLDPSLLSRVLEVRRWRRVGRVQSRRFLALLPGRVGALLQAELRRQTRRPAALAIWAALVLAHYAVTTVAPSLTGVSQVIGAYLAAGRLCGGLRAVAGSGALRRSLGGSETTLRLVHLVIPTLGTALWWALTTAAAGPSPGALAVVLVGGVMAAAYRAATRPTMTYGGSASETPFGAFPTELVLQLARGWDLLGVVIVLRLVLAT